MDVESPVPDRITKMIASDIQSAGQLMLIDKKKSSKKVLRTNRRNTRSFEKRLNQLWGTPFRLLELFMELSLESGADFNASVCSEAEKNDDLVFWVLCRLHGRACRIAQEMLTLMRRGYASGAFSRWRTLHEMAVVAFFIKMHGRDAAERYIQHDVIESSKAMDQYQKHCIKLGYEPYSKEQIEEAKKAQRTLVQKYDDEFKKDYGWAAKFVGNSNPTLSMLEKAVNLDHLRPYYKLASHDIHAGSKGIMFNLGLRRELNEEVIFAGPSNAGMAEPGQAAAMSLYQITVCLLSMSTYPRIENLIMLEALELLEDEVCNEFSQSHQRLEASIMMSGKPRIGKPRRTLLASLDAGDRHPPG